AGAGQALPQAPQLARSPWRSASHPSRPSLLQSANPLLHDATAQTPATQVPVALASIVQSAPHAPQLARSEPRFASQPLSGWRSQSAKSPVHANAHVPAVHVGVAWAAGAQ